MHDSMKQHRSKHDQILGTSPRLKSHSLCVSEVPNGNVKYKEKWDCVLPSVERGVNVAATGRSQLERLRYVAVRRSL